MFWIVSLGILIIKIKNLIVKNLELSVIITDFLTRFFWLISSWLSVYKKITSKNAQRAIALEQKNLKKTSQNSFFRLCQINKARFSLTL